MMISQILTEWTGTGATGDPRRPLVSAAYPMDWHDISEQPSENIPPAINAMTIEAVLDETTLTAIEADPRFVVLLSEVYIAPQE